MGEPDCAGRCRRKDTTQVFLLADAKSQQTLGPLHNRLVRQLLYKVDGVGADDRSFAEFVLVASPEADLSFRR